METMLLTVLLLCCCTLELLILLLFLRPLLLLRQSKEQSGGQPRIARSQQPQLPPGETVAVLQELQRLLKQGSLSGNPSLADVAHLIYQVQTEFGEVAELEQVIQQLVIQDALGLMGEQQRAMRTLQSVEARQRKSEQRLRGIRQHSTTRRDEVPA